MNAVTYSCIIVEDEPPACKLLQNYIEKAGCFKLKGIYHTAEEGLDYLKSNRIDVLFTDIKMAGMDGLQMLDRLKTNSFKAIITSAFDSFGVQAYNLDVIDYLVKPYSFERFMRAVNKIKGAVICDNEQNFSATNEKQFIFIKADRKFHRVYLSDIIYIHALGNYLKIITKERTFIIRSTMNNLESKLPEKLFMRVHKSFLININYVSSVAGNKIYIASGCVPLGDTFKDAILSRIGTNAIN
ncbi:MAG: LytTR family DNA-binding domain-containing protein [Chitinophagales bacterium]|nr:LytTR family DNA-binding domain-containing protein [Chitinophagales bacterium]MDW8273103.1 LytTR family DNA-binding domain-containing protein [Chitinophagales bacterium]